MRLLSTWERADLYLGRWPAVGPWRWLQRGTKLLADQLAPASFFILILVAKGPQLPSLLAQAGGAEGLERGHIYAGLANYVLTCLFLVVVVGLFLIRRPAFRKTGGRRGQVVAIAGTLMPLAIGVTAAGSGRLALVVATFLIMVGLVISLVGLLALRRCFGIMPEVRGMVTEGLYQHLRHPIYVGESIATLGITLSVLSPLTAAMLVAYLLLQWRRALNEEAVLAATYPQYLAYASRTRQFVPGLW